VTYTIEELQKMMDEYGNLNLSHTKITSLPDGLTVGGNLNLSHTKITSLPDGLTVGGWLDLSYTDITSLPDNLTVGGGLDLSHTKITSLPDGLTVGGGLYLSYTDITALPDNLTVGGGLNLSHTKITSLPDGLTVGGWLDLSYTDITSLPDNLTVGGNLHLGSTAITNPEHYNKLIEGTYVPGKYLYADRILTHVRSRKIVGDYTLYKGKIKGRNAIFDGTYYAHCDSFRDGIADIKFKHAAERGAEQYRGRSLDQAMSFEEAKTMYRVITGACRQGTELFVSRLPEVKEAYTAREVIDLTAGQYNSEKLREFFEI